MPKSTTTSGQEWIYWDHSEHGCVIYYFANYTVRVWADDDIDALVPYKLLVSDLPELVEHAKGILGEK